MFVTLRIGSILVGLYVPDRGARKMSDKDGLLDGEKDAFAPTPNNPNPLFHERGGSPREKLWISLFAGFVVIMVMISVIISFVRGAEVSGVYVLLGVSILSIGMVELILLYWSRTGNFPPEKSWFLYFVGICIVLESIFTDVLLFHVSKAGSF